MAEQAARAAFLLHRALVYGALLLLIAALLAAIDWLGTTVLHSGRAALAFEAAAALVIGFRLAALAAATTRGIDRVFFPARYRSARRLERVAAGLRESDDEAVLAPALVDEVVASFDLASAALFVRVGDGAFVPDLTVGWEDGTPSVPPRDPFLLHVAGARGAFALDRVEALRGAPAGGALRPRVVLPIRSRDGLAAFAVYGARRNGAALDPDAVALLDELARAAAVACDRAEAARMRAINAELRAALAAAMAAG